VRENYDLSVCCLGRDYRETLARLKSMRTQPKSNEGVGRRMGIAV
jgi:hypothetical protein